MRRARLVAVTVVQIACLVVQTSAGPRRERCSHADLADDPAVLHTCWRLLASERYGFGHLEAAAFIVRQANGKFAAVDWPVSYERDSARWSGAFPAGTVAIVHTHPNWIPDPSNLDIETAHRVRVPVYVLTRKRITKTDGVRVETVVDGDWRPAECANCVADADKCRG